MPVFFSKSVFAFTLLLAAVLCQPVQAQTRVKVGTLTCTVEGGVGFVFGSTKQVRCLFNSGNNAPSERYAGTINRYGLDIGVTGQKTIVWAVLATTTKLDKGALNGSYVGPSGSAAVGVGGGANLLVGGSNDTVGLQPLSIEGQTGLGIAVAIADLTLRSAE